MNETINKCRSVALEILKPSKLDLEHGLELHRNSIVCDAYGFSPYSAPDGDALKKTVEVGASAQEFRDILQDSTATRCVIDVNEQAEYKEAWEASGVTCVLQNAGACNPSAAEMIKRHAYFTYVTDMLRDFVVKAATPDDIVLAKKEGKHCLYFSSNGVPCTQQWFSMEEELGFLRILFLLGCRMMHLTYNRRNMIGDGCGEPGNAGLSDFGRSVVAEMNRIGLIVDVAHSGWKTSSDAAECSTMPITASHSGCCAVNMHCRNKPDEVIRSIAEKGGYIGISCIPAFLGGTGDIKALLDHVDYVCKTFGVDHAAIGTDIPYKSSSNQKEWDKIPPRAPGRKHWEMDFWRLDDALFDKVWQQDCQIQSLAWTNWPLFTVGLVQRGYSDDDIQKIIGGNVLRMAEKVLAGFRRNNELILNSSNIQ